MWNIDLASLNMNLKSVRSLATGVEGAGAAGTLYFDDIALYASAPGPVMDWRVAASADAVTDAFHTPAVSMIIEGELSPGPATFGVAAKDISNRPKTTAKVVWDIPVWTTVHAKGPEERTPDISGIIQQIVNQADWRGDRADVPGQSGQTLPGHSRSRVVRRGAEEAPLLHISYK